MRTVNWFNQLNKLKTSMRVPLLIIFALCVVIALLIIFSPRSQKQTEPTNLPLIASQVINITSYKPQVTLYGSIQANNQSTLRSVVTATVINIHENDGDTVQKGDVLIELDKQELEIEQKRLQAEERGLQAELSQELQQYKTQKRNHQRQKELVEIASRNLNRHQTLLKQDLTSEALVDQSQKELESTTLTLNNSALSLKNHTHRKQALEAKIDKVRADKQRVDLDITRCTIRAPFSGRVIDRLVGTGERVQVGTPIVEIYETNSLHVEAQVPDYTIQTLQSELKKGKPITAETTIGNQTQKLTLSRLSAEVLKSRTGINAFFIFESPENHYAIGRNVKLTLSLPAVNDTFTLPNSALYQGNRIYRIKQGKLHALTANKIGQLSISNTQHTIFKSSEARTGDRFMTTHLPNARSGLAVQTEE